MALAAAFHEFRPEVLAMEIPICRRHRLRMIEVDRFRGCFKCQVEGCESTADLPQRQGDAGQGGPARRLVCVEPEPMGDSPLMQRSLAVVPVHWLAHIGIKWPLLPVPQSNASDDYSIMNGPPAPGGGGSKSGRKRKKSKGGKTFTNTPWASDGTNAK